MLLSFLQHYIMALFLLLFCFYSRFYQTVSLVFQYLFVPLKSHVSTTLLPFNTFNISLKKIWCKAGEFF